MIVAFNRLFYAYQWNRIPYAFLFSSFFSSFLFGLVHFGIFFPQNLQEKYVNDSHKKIRAHHVPSSESAEVTEGKQTGSWFPNTNTVQIKML